MIEYKSDVEAADALRSKYNELRKEISRVIIGQDQVVEDVLTCIFSNGHALLIGVPGLAKTLLVKTVAQALDLSFSRIQFTPDLMPSDITGSEILDESRHFKFIKGPLFANIVLADEINRTPPKTQAALLEAMQEKNVSVGGQQHVLQEPFFVLATQNPIEQEGTYPLPEAQLDRFMFNVMVKYPSFEEEMQVVRSTTSGTESKISRVLTAAEIALFQQIVRKLPVTDHVMEYAVRLASKTRPGTSSATEQVNRYVSFGAGPRASQFLVVGAKCHALLHGKYAPDIEDVQAVAAPILRHRLVKNYKAEAEGVSTDDIIKALL
jgi:MoxR-like ATPase